MFFRISAKRFSLSFCKFLKKKSAISQKNLRFPPFSDGQFNKHKDISKGKSIKINSWLCCLKLEDALKN